MSFYFVQFVTGLASACSLFLVASGLSIIFGVTRIVNFAHGAFYMLGAYVGFTLTDRLSGAVGFWGAIVLAAIAVAAIGTLVEIVLLRRIYDAPELFQLLATFGVTLVVEDLVLLIWGPSELLGPRAPGFKGAVDLFGRPFPSYDLLLIALGPLVLALLWLLFRRTTWGVLVRAATQDREMVAALGVDQKWLFTSVFALGVFLAALGGALELPREAANHTMDLQVITEALVVVVIGGLGSVTGTFLAAIIVSELNAFGILVFPGDFDRSRLSRHGGGARRCGPGDCSGAPRRPRAPRAARYRALAAARARRPRSSSLLGLGGGGAACRSSRAITSSRVATEVLIFVLFAASLHFLIARRRARLVRPRRLFRPRLLWRGARAQTLGLRHGRPRSSLGSASALPARLSSAGSACASPASISPC